MLLKSIREALGNCVSRFAAQMSQCDDTHCIVIIVMGEKCVLRNIWFKRIATEAQSYFKAVRETMVLFMVIPQKKILIIKCTCA